MLSFYLSLIIDEPSRGKFEQIYREHRHTMLWVAQSILHDRALAEDAVHDAFLRIIDHLENISPENCNKTRSLLVVIVRNIAIDLRRKQKFLAESDLGDYDEFLVDPQADPEQALVEKEGYQDILYALTKMKPAFADVLSLQISHELDYRQIADLLGISPENARVRCYRARRILARYLEEGDGNGSASQSTVAGSRGRVSAAKPERSAE